MGYFVVVKTSILEHIEIASKILILYHFCRWAILSVNPMKKPRRKTGLFQRYKSTAWICDIRFACDIRPRRAICDCVTRYIRIANEGKYHFTEREAFDFIFVYTFYRLLKQITPSFNDERGGHAMLFRIRRNKGGSRAE